MQGAEAGDSGEGGRCSPLPQLPGNRAGGRWTGGLLEHRLSCPAPADSTQGLQHTSPKLIWAPAYGWSSSPRKYDHDSVDTSIPIDSHVACSAQERKTLSAHWLIHNTPTQASMHSRQNSEEHSLSLHWRAALQHYFTDTVAATQKLQKSSAFQEGAVKSNAFQEGTAFCTKLRHTCAQFITFTTAHSTTQFLNHSWQANRQLHPTAPSSKSLWTANSTLIYSQTRTRAIF